MTATIPTIPRLETALKRQRLLRLLREKQRRLDMLQQRPALEEDLGAFFREAWKVLEPGRKLAWSWCYELQAEYLWLVREGKLQEYFPGVVGMIDNVPPRTAKSTFWTICFPVWTWTKYPDRRFQCFSYSQGLSEEHSLKRRDLILSPWFQQLWGDRFKLRVDQHEKANFSNDKTGSMTASSVGGTAIGKGGDTLILDDPINADQALSEVERTKANNWIDSTLRSRLNDPDSGLILMIMQRLNDLDPTGFVLTAERERWIWHKLPLEAEEEETWKFPISGRVVKRQPGEILMPDRFSQTTVARLKTKRLTWSCQYQQRPAPLEGNMVKFADVRYYGGVDPLTGVADPPLPAQFDLIFVSCDAAFKDLKTSDYVAVATIGVKGPNRYVLDVVNRHLDCDATEAECKRQRERVWGDGQRAGSVLIEDKANGSAVIKRLKRVVPGVVAVEPEGGKVARMFATVPEWQSNNWWVDRNAAWTELYLDQLTKFPAGAHDDMVDCTSQAAIWIQKSGVGMLQFYAEQAAGQGAPTNGRVNGPTYVEPPSAQLTPAQHQSQQFDPWGVFR